jgi:hypothetical protein
MTASARGEFIGIPSYGNGHGTLWGRRRESICRLVSESVLAKGFAHDHDGYVTPISTTSRSRTHRDRKEHQEETKSIKDGLHPLLGGIAFQNFRSGDKKDRPNKARD